MAKEISGDKLCKSLIIFILCNLFLTGCVSAQCGDCDDKNPCTKDICDGTICKHKPQSCEEAISPTVVPFGIGANSGTGEREDGEGQRNQGYSIFREEINSSAESNEQPSPEPSARSSAEVCDDNNPCTRDSYGAGGCVYDPVNCDDGNPGTADFCGPSGCGHTPLLGAGSNANVNVPEIPGPVLPDVLPYIDENFTINEPENQAEKPNGIAARVAEAVAPQSCDDGNDSTLDSYRDGACVNEPIDIRSSISENDSNARSSSEALMAGHARRCDDHNPCTEDILVDGKCENKPIKCDDGNPSTFDYCYKGMCYNTTTSCDDENLCTIDSYNGKICVYTRNRCDDGKPCTYDRCDPRTGCFNPWKCNDNNPCTVDTCDPVRGCVNSPVVCGPGKKCINGVCRYLCNPCYPYYPYHPYYPYDAYIYPYVAPISTAPTAVPPVQSYTIPAGTVITLPWSSSVTALGILKVENGIAYSSGSPLRFVRTPALEEQAVSGLVTGLPISEKAYMIGLSWKDAGFTLALIKPDGSTLPVQGDNQEVIHHVGSKYDYYFLKNAGQGNWGIEVRPVNAGASGAGYSLITGLVRGAAPINQP